MPFEFRCPHCNTGYQVKDELAGKKTKCMKCGNVILLTAPEREFTKGGSEVYRHAIRERELELATGDEKLIEAIEKHIERYIGKYDRVFHEIVSDMIHIDVHMIPPTPKRNWHTLVTSGMSERPMHVPPGASVAEYAEMVLCLPPTWNLSDKALKSNGEEFYWPIRWMKQLARIPHEYQTFFTVGHTIPNGDPPEPFHRTTKMCCWITFGPPWFDDGFKTLKMPDGRQITFLAMIPIYKEEMELKLNKGPGALSDKLADLIKPETKGGHKYSELMNPHRKNVAAKRFGIF